MNTVKKENMMAFDVFCFLIIQTIHGKLMILIDATIFQFKYVVVNQTKRDIHAEFQIF